LLPRQSGKSHFAVQLRDILKCFQSPPTGKALAPAGIDVTTVQEWLGHESLAATQKYRALEGNGEPTRSHETAVLEQTGLKKRKAHSPKLGGVSQHIPK
jgi:hypothetical protein